MVILSPLFLWWRKLASGGKNLPSGTIVLSQSASDANPIIGAGFSYLGQANFDQYQAVAATIPANSWYPASVGLTEGHRQLLSRPAIESLSGVVRRIISLLMTGPSMILSRDTWEPIPTTGALHQELALRWCGTGTELVIWGGYVFTGSYMYFNDGARYNPTTKTWSPLGVTGVPVGRGECAYGYNAATSEMVIWGGFNGPRLTDGARYNFTTQSWSAINNTGNPGQLLNTAFHDGNRQAVHLGWLFSLQVLLKPIAVIITIWPRIPGRPCLSQERPLPVSKRMPYGRGTELLIWGEHVRGIPLIWATAEDITRDRIPWPSLIPSGPVAELGSNAVFANNKMFISGINGSAFMTIL